MAHTGGRHPEACQLPAASCQATCVGELHYDDLVCDEEMEKEKLNGLSTMKRGETGEARVMRISLM